mgnify:CR=1 FL=1
MIRFENVTKKYKNKTVLSDLSFEIKKGEIVALIGKSGCGKTTTLKIINRLIKPTHGKVTINDQDINEMNLISLRRSIGYVIQQTGLFPHMTAKENIEIIAKSEKIDINEINSRTEYLMDMVNLDQKLLNSYPVELSGGQQQRVGVARAFSLDPDIILMDEPFSALDPITRTELQDQLMEIQDKLKKTIVFVTHDMDEAIKIADKICIMDKGQIVQYDTPENILKKPNNTFIKEFVGENRIWSSPEYIKAKDIMIKNPVVISEELFLNKAVERMKISKIDYLTVINPQNRKVTGLLTGRKILSTDIKNIFSVKVKDFMDKDVITVHYEDSILDIMKIFDKKNISCIPVIEENNILSGIITRGSLISTLSEQYIMKGEEINIQNDDI